MSKFHLGLISKFQSHNNGSGDVVNEEDEIDDDEENALNVTGPFTKQPTRPSSGPGIHSIFCMLQIVYSRFSRCSTARGPSTRLSLVGNTKVKVH